MFVDPAERKRSRQRVLGLVTLLVTAAWCAGAWAVYKKVGTFSVVKGFDTLVGGLASTPAPRPAKTTSTPATRPALPANPLAWFINPFANLGDPSASQPASQPKPAGPAPKPPSVKVGEAAIVTQAWAEGVRFVWLGMMGVVGLIMLTAALLGIVGSERTVGAHHFAAWTIIASTLATFLAISLLIDKAGFPPMPIATYVLITLVLSGYGWILLFFGPSAPSET